MNYVSSNNGYSPNIHKRTYWIYNVTKMLRKNVLNLTERLKTESKLMYETQTIQ